MDILICEELAVSKDSLEFGNGVGYILYEIIPILPAGLDFSFR